MPNQHQVHLVHPQSEVSPHDASQSETTADLTLLRSYQSQSRRRRGVRSKVRMSYVKLETSLWATSGKGSLSSVFADDDDCCVREFGTSSLATVGLPLSVYFCKQNIVLTRSHLPIPNKLPWHRSRTKTSLQRSTPTYRKLFSDSFTPRVRKNYISDLTTVGNRKRFRSRS